MDARPLLKPWITEEDFQIIGQAVADGYSLCDAVMSKTPLFSAFAIGRDFRSHLLGLAVEFELNRLCSLHKHYFSEVKPNAARNCWHLRMNIRGLALTSHFMGQKEFRRSARTAKNRDFLADRNGDLFGHEAQELDLFQDTGFAYAQLLHGGSVKPELSMLAIPSRDQSIVVASCHLPIPEAKKVEVEKVQDEFLLQLIKQSEDIENEQIDQAS